MDRCLTGPSSDVVGMTSTQDQSEQHQSGQQPNEDELTPPLLPPNNGASLTTLTTTSFVPASTPISAWQKLTSRVCLSVPLAETWHDHPTIRDQEGGILFQVLKEDSIGQLIAGEPVLRMILGDASGQVVAVIVRHTWHGHDGFQIFGPRSDLCMQEGSQCTHSRWKWLEAPLHLWRRHNAKAVAPYQFESPVTRSSPSLSQEDDPPADGATSLLFYPLVTVTQGIFGKTYMVESVDGSSIRWRANNPSFRRTLLFCPCLIFLGCCVWEFEFDDLIAKSGGADKFRSWISARPGARLSGGDEETEPAEQLSPVVLRRDQLAQKLEIEKGVSPLVAVCVAYAMDRLTRSVS
jgi:hypothetical protein